MLTKLMHTWQEVEGKEEYTHGSSLWWYRAARVGDDTGKQGRGKRCLLPGLLAFGVWMDCQAQLSR